MKYKIAVLALALIAFAPIAQAQLPHRTGVAPSKFKRSWGPEQACGQPDTNGAGDIPSAWASLSQDDQDEWLMLTYEKAVKPLQVLVYETFNPGALTRVTAFDGSGKEIELWSGTDPTATTVDHGVSKIQIKPEFATRKIKLYLDSKKVPGWNEIDAVGLVDEQTEKPLWAVSAEASSTYAEQTRVKGPLEKMQDRIDRLERKQRELEEEIRQLKRK